ncbi:MAG: acyltransferase [Bacteroidota bacterium]|nr:acyltransferase [Bacteroidota bacterium]
MSSAYYFSTKIIVYSLLLKPARMANNDYRLKNIYLPQFDGFRGVFMFTILIAHHHYYYVNLPSSLGYATMHSFFIMSSFLITRGLLQDKKKAPTFKIFFTKFYIKRVLRIFPVYFAYLLFTVIVAISFSRTSYKPILGINYELKYFGWMLLTFTYNFKDLMCLFTHQVYNKSLVFPHLWSLSLEEQFYIIVPFMMYFLSNKTILRLSVIMIIIFPVIRIIGYHWLGTMTNDDMHRAFIIYRCTIFQYDTFFYGTLLVLYDVKWDDNTMKKLFYFIFILFLAIIPINAWMIHIRTGQDLIRITTSYAFMIQNGQYIYIDTLTNILCTLFFYICFKYENSFAFFRNRILIILGSKLSYSSYVYQYIFIIPTLLFLFPFLFERLHIGRFPAELLSMILSISAILFLSRVSYQTMENYFLKKKDKYLAKYKSK